MGEQRPGVAFQALLHKFRQARIEEVAAGGSLVQALSPVPQLPPLDAERAKRLLADFANRHWVAREARSGAAQGMNVWRHAGLRRSEVRNVAVIAWLLDPRGDHGQGLRFYRCLSAEAPELLPIFPPGDEPYVRTERWVDDQSRIDIELVGRASVVVVEAKIDAQVLLTQLESYWALVHRRSAGRTMSGVLLTAGAQVPSGAHGFRPLHWDTVTRALTRFAGDDTAAARDPLVRALASQLCDHLNQILKDL